MTCVVCLQLNIVLIVVLFLSGVCGQNESDRDMYEDSDDEEKDENDTHEDFLGKKI